MEMLAGVPLLPHQACCNAPDPPNGSALGSLFNPAAAHAMFVMLKSPEVEGTGYLRYLPWLSSQAN